MAGYRPQAIETARRLGCKAGPSILKIVGTPSFRLTAATCFMGRMQLLGKAEADTDLFQAALYRFDWALRH